jgi:predicted site-specific integrase-resolvase
MERKKQFEKLLDSQDVCFMLNVSKRTLQRFRSSGNLPYMPVNQKLYYRESDVLTFIGEHLKQGNKNILE